MQTIEISQDYYDFQQKTKKLAEIIDTYGVKSEEFEKYKKRHCNNKYGLLYIFKRFGVKSTEFFQFVRPFLIKQMSKFSYNEITEDDVNNCYIHIVNAHCGCYVEKKGEIVWKDAWVDDMEKITATRWINFLVTICRSVICNRDYHLNKHNLEIAHNDRLEDNLSASLLNGLNYASYSMKHFIFEKSMEEHLIELMNNRPTNNVLFSMIQWSLLEDDEVFQAPTSYNLGEVTNG